MCREKTYTNKIKSNVSFHRCLQGFYVLTVAHSNKTGFNFTLTLKVWPVAMEACVLPLQFRVIY